MSLSQAQFILTAPWEGVPKTARSKVELLVTKSIQNVKTTSFLDLERTSSSEDTGKAWHDPEAYLFTKETSSMKEETLPHSLRIVSSFFLINGGGEPNSGPNAQKQILKRTKHRNGIKYRSHINIFPEKVAIGFL